MTEMYDQNQNPNAEIIQGVNSSTIRTDANNGDDSISSLKPLNTNENQATLLVELVNEAKLFHSPDGKSFATFTKNHHKETWQIQSAGFKRHLQRNFYHIYSKAPNASAFKDALNTIEAKCQYDGEEREIFLRVAEYKGKIYVDLVDESWRVVEISESGWRIISDSPIRFFRTDKMKPLPIPERGGLIHDLRKYLNVKDDNSFILIVSWLIAAFRPKKPFPVLVLMGEQGSAKSTTAQNIQRLIDPKSVELRPLPSSVRDLMISAASNWVQVFDNLSSINNNISDALCRLSTGGGFAARTLYTNGDEFSINVMRPMIFTGIGDFVKREDLIDRCIMIYLEPIHPSIRKDERSLSLQFKEDSPKIFGALLDAISRTLRNVGQTNISNKPRMADFAIWAQAAEEGLGFKSGSFMRAYQSNLDEALETAIDLEPFVNTIHEFIQDRDQWTGTKKDLLEDLSKYYFSGYSGMTSSLPKTPRGLAEKLKRTAPLFRTLGIVFKEEKREPGTGARLFSIIKERGE